MQQESITSLALPFRNPLPILKVSWHVQQHAEDKASSVGVPKPSSYLPAGTALELPLCSASDHTHKFQSSSIWSQAFLSLDYFKHVFNTTLESLSQRVGCCLPVASASPLRWGKGKIKQKCLPRGNEKVIFPMKQLDIFLCGRTASSRGHQLELLHPVASLKDNGFIPRLNPIRT